MAYVPLTTWNSGDVILAGEVMDELDNVRLYMKQIPQNAFETSRWIDTQHVMRGDYSPVTNQAQFVSGCFAGTNRNYGEAWTYITVYNTSRLGINTYAYIPLTSLTLEIRRASTMVINWYAAGSCRDNLTTPPGVEGETDVRLYIGNKGLGKGTPCRLHEEVVTAGAVDPRMYRYFPSGFWIEDFTVGTYNVGLVGKSTTSKTHFFSWGLSCEAFAL